MTKPLNEFVVCQIVTLKNMGFSYQQICNRLGLHNRFTARSGYQRFFKKQGLSSQEKHSETQKTDPKGRTTAY